MRTSFHDFWQSLRSPQERADFHALVAKNGRARAISIMMAKQLAEHCPEAGRTIEEIEAAWEADLAELPADAAAWWRAWMQASLERDIVELPDGSFGVLALEDDDLEDDGDDPDPGGGEDLPLLHRLDEIEPRGPPPSAGPPATGDGGRRADGRQANNGSPIIETAGAAPQEHLPEHEHDREPPRGRVVGRWWQFEERCIDDRGRGTTRDIMIDVTSIRSISAVPNLDQPWLLEAILRVAGIRDPIRITQPPCTVVQRLEMLAAGHVVLRE